MIFVAALSAIICCAAAFYDLITAGQLTVMLSFYAFFVVAWEPRLRVVAFAFASLMAINYGWLKLTNGHFSGPNFFVLRAIAECIILLAIFRIRHKSAQWVCIAAAALCINHLLTALSYRFDSLNLFYTYWEITVPIVELSQIAGIVISMDRVWNRLFGKYQQKDDSTWIAKTFARG